MDARLTEVLQARMDSPASGSGRSPRTKRPETDAIVSQMVARLRDHHLRLLTPHRRGAGHALGASRSREDGRGVERLHRRVAGARAGIASVWDTIRLRSRQRRVRREETGPGHLRGGSATGGGESATGAVHRRQPGERRAGRRAAWACGRCTIDRKPEASTDGAGAEAPAREVIAHWRDLRHSSRSAPDPRRSCRSVAACVTRASLARALVHRIVEPLGLGAVDVARAGTLACPPSRSAGRSTGRSAG